ncbi:MAG: hypothetical protein J6S85_19605 [Methanobrevibacter sp.]|nr:hypothetical protein [Methanobrevibacter sp.]
MAGELNTTDEQITPKDTNETPIELIVEDGSCVANANSYVSLEDADEYQRSRNRSDWAELEDNQKISCILKATQYIDSIYDWKGRAKYEEQFLAFPRVAITDNNGFDVSHIIPSKLKVAVYEAAYFGFKEDLFTVYESSSGNVKRDKKVVTGAVEKEVEYFSSKDSAIEFVSRFTILDSILKGLYLPKNSNTVNCKAVWSY